jgi:hypothetical protein
VRQRVQLRSALNRLSLNLSIGQARKRHLCIYACGVLVQIYIFSGRNATLYVAVTMSELIKSLSSAFLMVLEECNGEFFHVLRKNLKNMQPMSCRMHVF